MKYCPKCGTQNEDENAFCGKCGNSLGEIRQEESLNQYTYAAPVTPVAPQEAPKKKKKKKKWWIAIVVLLVIFIFFWAIGKSGDGSSNDPEKDSNNIVAEDGSNTSNVGDYNIELKDSRITTDYDGDKILIVTYTFTNNSDEAECFAYSVTDKAFQDGIELGDVWSSYGIDGLSFDNKSKEIKPGKSLDVQCAYELNDETTDVEIEFKLFTVWSDKVYETFVIELQ